MVMMVLKCVDFDDMNDDILVLFIEFNIYLLFNILGVKNVKDVVFVVYLVCEVLVINWLKLEIYFDFKYLMFDLIEILKVVV